MEPVILAPPSDPSPIPCPAHPKSFYIRDLHLRLHQADQFVPLSLPPSNHSASLGLLALDPHHPRLLPLSAAAAATGLPARRAGLQGAIRGQRRVVRGHGPRRWVVGLVVAVRVVLLRLAVVLEDVGGQRGCEGGGASGLAKVKSHEWGWVAGHQERLMRGNRTQDSESGSVEARQALVI